MPSSLGGDYLESLQGWLEVAKATEPGGAGKNRSHECHLPGSTVMTISQWVPHCLE